MANDKEQTNILNKLTVEKPLSFEANQRLHALFARDNELRNILKPPCKNIPIKRQELPDNALEKIEKKYNALFAATETDEYCQNCGTPNGHNNMNGKPWCFKCNRPLIVTFKKPERKPNAKLKGVSVEEQEQFILRQKQLGLA